jgi:hypothetical protein
MITSYWNIKGQINARPEKKSNVFFTVDRNSFFLNYLIIDRGNTEHMTWKGIDFHGIVNLDQSLIDELRSYLTEKESQLGKAILEAIEITPPASQPSLYAPSSPMARSLLDSTEIFAKAIRTNKQMKKSRDAWKHATHQINSSLWEYVEIIEGCIIELFQQLKSVGFEKWDPDLAAVVDTVHEVLLQKIRELYRVIDLLKASLKEYRGICQIHLFSFKGLIDSSIISSLNKCEAILLHEKEEFMSKYQGFVEMNEEANESLKKFSQFTLFNKLEEHIKNDLLRNYKLLKIWNLNKKKRVLSPREPIRVMRRAFTIEKATALFKAYFSFLRTTLFERSKMLKMGSKELFEDESTKKLLLEAVNGYRAEVHTLGATIGQYREFFLESHPDPYVRTRWGFPEWLVGPEPQQSKDLQHLVFKLEKLDKLYADVGHAVHRGRQPGESLQLSKNYREILRVLHEMGQPLTSRSVMKSRSERILTILREMNELGSFNPEVIDYVGKALAKAMRADWQYHVLFEFTSFHYLYEIHQGLFGPIESRSHLNRMNKFRSIIKKLREWVNDRDVHKHVAEIEVEMSDLQQYLQEFLAQVQRMIIESAGNPEILRKVVINTSAELLEYRYLFGTFFHFLHQNEPEGKTIRNQFLFVDQYFESVENFVHEN